MSDEKNLRDYGLPNSEVTGTPTWTEAVGAPPCPNCGAKLCQVKVAVTQNLLRGNSGTSSYLGCPACPFASPALVIADAAQANTDKDPNDD